MNQPVSFILIGAGRRGLIYANIIKQHPNLAQLVGIIEPKLERQKIIYQLFNKNKIITWYDWQELLTFPKLADAVIITLQDHLHAQVATALAKKGYHILLEKPMALSLKETQQLNQTVKDTGIFFSICYPMRYSKLTTMLYRFIHQEKRIGELVTVNHFEPVGLWRQLQNFVRGDWNNCQKSTFMLMSKACHDIDWLCYLINQPCLSIASMGSLFEFHPKEFAQKKDLHCPSCLSEKTCPYSAKRFYLGKSVYRQRLIHDLVKNDTPEEICQALEKSPWGECVYSGNNNVVDHQVVSFSFEKNITANFTMTGFTPQMERRTYFGGTRGAISCNDEKIHLYDFLTDQTTIFDPNTYISGEMDHHQGGDIKLFINFANAIQQKRPELILSNAETTLKSSKLIFLAEKSRLERRVIPCTE